MTAEGIETMSDLTCSIQTTLNRIAAFSMFALVGLSAAYAQSPPANKTATAGWTPLAQQPGAPAGSYALSGFDNVNLFNGNLNFRLPLMHVGDRGQRWLHDDVATRAALESADSAGSAL